MAAHEPLTPSQKRFLPRVIIMSLVTVLIMTAVAFFVLKPLIPDGPRRADDVITGSVAFVLLSMALVSGLVQSLYPTKHAPLQRRRLAQVLTGVIGGAILLLPSVGQRFIDPTLNFAIILVLMVGALVLTWLRWRGADELQRTLMRDAYVASYFIITAALTIYAAGERLGLLGGVTAWGALGLVTLTQFACSYWIFIRRGHYQPPSDQ